MTLDETLKKLPLEEAILLDNVTCPYCACDVSIERTKEHVVGRRFVPRGMLDRQWNLIMWACARCNGRKADLENDISAITMQPDAFGRHADDADVLAPEAIRRGKTAFSRRTKKLVKDSAESFSIKMALASGVELKGRVDMRAAGR